MISGRAALAATAAFVLGSATAVTAAAAEPAPPVRVVYSAEGLEECPNEAEFVAAVRERLAHGTLAEGVEAAREYRVGVRRVGTRFVARLELRDAGGATRTREVGAETCADVSRAIALVTALAIDAGGSAGDGEAEGDGTLSASEALGLVGPSAPPPPPTVPRPLLAPPVERRAEPDGAAALPPELELGVRATLSSPRGPTVLPGAEVFAALRDAGGSWTLELGVAGERGWRTTSGPGAALFSFVGARLRACALSVPLGARVELWPCASLEGGALVAEGFIARPDTQTDTWLAAGVAARLTYRLSSGSLHLEGGPVLPITRNHYVFGSVEEPVAVAHDVPIVGFQLALGGALRIF